VVGTFAGKRPRVKDFISESKKWGKVSESTQGKRKMYLAIEPKGPQKGLENRETQPFVGARIGRKGWKKCRADLERIVETQKKTYLKILRSKNVIWGRRNHQCQKKGGGARGTSGHSQKI